MKVAIRPLRVEDAATSYKWRNDPEIWRYTGSKPDKIITLSIEKNWIKKAVADVACRRFAIVVDGTYVGNVYLTDITDQDAQYHIFIGDKSYWGRGVAQAASKKILKYARETLSLDRVYLVVQKNNAAAIAVYGKLGFREVSVNSEGVRMSLALGEWVDEK